MGAGVFATPVLPGISDQPEAIGRLVGRAAEVGVDFLAFGGLTLRPGRQKNGYFDIIREHHADLLRGYEIVYRSNSRSGRADPRYDERVDRRFGEALERYGLAGRIPRRLFSGLIPRYTEAAVLLDHREFDESGGGDGRGELARAGDAIQEWARQLVSKRGRKKSFDYREIEREFSAMLADSSIEERLGLPSRAVRFLQGVFEP